MTTRRLAGLVAVIAVALVVTLSAPAWAGDDPYGSTTTTTVAPGETPSCNLDVGEGPPGAAVTATVGDVPLGTTVRILFDGQEVGRATADDTAANAASPVVVFGGRTLGAGTATATVEIDFVVPARDPGRYAVVAVGPAFTSTCTFGSQGDFGVLAAGAATDGGDEGSLPKTGVYIGILVAIGIALVVVGRTVLAASRRRRSTTTSQAAHRSPSVR
jgi:hypothetical protein